MHLSEGRIRDMVREELLREVEGVDDFTLTLEVTYDPRTEEMMASMIDSSDESGPSVVLRERVPDSLKFEACRQLAVQVVPLGVTRFRVEGHIAEVLNRFATNKERNRPGSMSGTVYGSEFHPMLELDIDKAVDLCRAAVSILSRLQGG